MRNVDAVCEEITSKEKALNLLFLSVGTLQVGGETEEGLYYPMALTIYGRNRFISNLLPLLRRGQGLRRVVTTYSAGWEGQIHMDDFQGRQLGLRGTQGHQASITTLALEAHHKTAPEVSFVHNFPGAVESGIARGDIGWLMRFLKTIFAILGSLVHIPLEEAGDRHLFFCTSARFSNGASDAAGGAPLGEELEYARGIDCQPASGVYSVDQNGESAGASVEKLLASFRERSLAEQIMQKIDADVNKALAPSVDK